MNTRRSLLLCSVVLFGDPTLANSTLNGTHTPSRAEWIRQSFLLAIYEESNLWRNRVSIRVVVIEKEAKVMVTMQRANGEPEPSKIYISNVKGDVQRIFSQLISQYEWAKDLRLEVNFLK